MKRRHIDVIDIRPFLAIDLDVHEELVHHRRCFGVFETLMRHHVAPMAGGIADRQQDGLIRFLRFLERRFAPDAPMDGIVGVLQQIRTGGLAQLVGGHDTAFG